jgi:O-antigen/teichoic acid export membrane protein
LNISFFFTQIGLSIYFILILDQQLYGYFVANIIGNLLSGLIMGLIMLRFAHPHIRGGRIRESLRFSLPLIPSNIVAAFSSIADRFILQKYTSLETLGIYAIGLKFTNLINAFHSANKLSFVPYMVESASKEKTKGRYELARMSMFYVFPILILGLIIASFTREFVFLANRAAYFPIINIVP